MLFMREDYDLEFNSIDVETELDLACLSNILKNASRLSVKKLSENLQRECETIKAVCDKIASIYIGLFGDRGEEPKNKYSFWEFCDRAWNYEWSRETLLEIQNVYVECQASIKAIIEVDEEEILDKNVDHIIKKSSYVKPEEIFEYIHEKISESMNNIFEEYATFDRFFASSQTCLGCGYKNQEVKNLAVRSWICPNCGKYHDRDTNAAINIRNEGMRIINALE